VMVVETGVALTEAGSAVTTTAIFVVFAAGVATSPALEGALHAPRKMKSESAARILRDRGINSPGCKFSRAILPFCDEKANLTHHQI
jgi:hypothetical protein